MTIGKTNFLHPSIHYSFARHQPVERVSAAQISNSWDARSLQQLHTRARSPHSQRLLHSCTRAIIRRSCCAGDVRSLIPPIARRVSRLAVPFFRSFPPPLCLAVKAIPCFGPSHPRANPACASMPANPPRSVKGSGLQPQGEASGACLSCPSARSHFSSSLSGFLAIKTNAIDFLLELSSRSLRCP